MTYADRMPSFADHPAVSARTGHDASADTRQSNGMGETEE